MKSIVPRLIASAVAVLMCAVAVAIVLRAFSVGELTGMYLLAGLALLFAWIQTTRHVARLRRLHVSRRNHVVLIELNGVECGTLSESAYAGMQLHALRQPRNYARQGVILLEILARLGWRTLWMASFALVVIPAGLFLFGPPGSREMLDQTWSTSGGLVMEVLPNALEMMFFVAILALVLSIFISPQPLPSLNAFSQCVEDAIRRDRNLGHAGTLRLIPLGELTESSLSASPQH